MKVILEEHSRKDNKHFTKQWMIFSVAYVDEGTGVQYVFTLYGEFNRFMIMESRPNLYTRATKGHSLEDNLSKRRKN